MDKFKAIGGLIEQKRVEQSLTQEELAKKLGVSISTISLYEAGFRKPTLERLTQIAEILKTPVSKFLAMDISEKVDLDLALRAQGLSTRDVEAIKNYIKIAKNAKEGKQEKSKK